MAHDLHVSLQQLTNCISRITNKPVGEVLSLSELGGSVVRDLHDSLRDPESGETAAALVRFFMTIPYARLDPSTRSSIAAKFPDLAPEADTKCLTLMGTVGDEPDWCSISGSRGHQAIPLMSEEGVEQIPMIARLLSELGLEIHQVLNCSAPSPSASAWLFFQSWKRRF